MKLRTFKGALRLVALLAISLSLAISAATQSPKPTGTKPTALDRYIAQPDPVYGWKLVNTIEGAGYRGYVLELTSQTWRSEKDVDRPVWKHWLTVALLVGIITVALGSVMRTYPRTPKLDTPTNTEVIVP